MSRNLFANRMARKIKTGELSSVSGANAGVYTVQACTCRVGDLSDDYCEDYAGYGGVIRAN